MTVPIASVRSACFTLMMFPSLSFRLLCSAIPMSVPMVSKISTNRKEKNTVKNSRESTLLKSNLQKIGASGSENGFQPAAGCFVTYDVTAFVIGSRVSGTKAPIIVVAIMPMRIEPGTLSTNNMMVITRPMIATIAAPLWMAPKPMIVPVVLERIPPSLKPMMVMNRPIPTATAFFMFAGIALMIASRTLNNERMMKRIPSRKTAVSPICQEYPIPIQTVYVKNAFSPIPGASATGRFAMKAMMIVVTPEAIAVAVNTPPFDIPVFASISGLTASMYDIARNVVIPATISFCTEVLRSCSLNNDVIDCS